MSTVFPEDEFDDWLSRAVAQSGSQSPSSRGISGAGGGVDGALKRLHQQVRGGSAHEPILEEKGVPQFALCARFYEKLKLHMETRQEVAQKGFSLRGISLEPIPRLLQAGGVLNLMIYDTLPDGVVRAQNGAARELLARLDFANLLSATDSGEPPLFEGETQ